jgi:hypothetical protein
MFVAAADVTPAGASRALRSVFQDDNLLLRSGPAARDATLDELAGLGVDDVRVLVGWADMAPQPGATRPPAGFDGADPDAYPPGTWDALDGVVREAAARGLGLIVTPTSPVPLWASRCARPTRTCLPDPSGFGRFVRALGARYPGVRAWGLWNEPDAHVRLTPQWVRRGGRWVPESPRLYRDLGYAAIGALRATGHGRDLILLGETAGVGSRARPATARPMSTIVFLRTLLCLPIRLPRGEVANRRGCRPFRPLAVTGFGHHPYVRGGSGSPFLRAPAGTLPINSLGALIRILDEAGRLRRVPRHLPLHLTEFGFQSDPPDHFLGLPLLLQAEFLNASEWVAWRNPRVASLAQYLLRDDVGSGGFQTGLRFHDRRAKPALAAYRLPIWVIRQGRGVTVWGRIRDQDRPQRVAIEHRAPGGAWRIARRVTTDTRGFLSVSFSQRQGVWRLRRADGVLSRVATAA